MGLSALCIKRPVLATVLSLVVILVGIVSYQRLTIREYPEIDEPTVSVTTTYRGASADIIETQITTIIEDSISGIEGIKTIRSSSRDENSRVNV